MSDLTDLFARAKAADLESVAGVKLYRAGRRMRGECPLCGASAGKKSGGAFSADVTAGVFKCFACDVGGDVIDLERLLRGGTAREAAERLAGPTAATRPSLVDRRPVRPEPRRADRGGAEDLASRIWRGTQPVRASKAQTYLEARGISAELVARLPAWGVRFHPRAPWGWDEAARNWIAAPALVCQVTEPGTEVLGIHCTYLAADGRAKARLDPAKRMFGPQKTTDGRPGGVWLTAMTAPGPLVVGEGIESTLSAMQLQGRPCRGVATLSLLALQGGWLADRWGRRDPAMVRPDPERPAFTWPEDPAAPWVEVILAVDRDMKPVRIKARKAQGGTGERWLSADERARICAGLAAAAWRRAGANAVRTIAPGAGRDFNDELREGLG